MKKHVATIALSLLALGSALGLAGCAGPGPSVTDCPAPPAVGLQPGESNVTGENMDDVAKETDRFGKDLIGMAADTAEACALEVGYSWRVFEQDGEQFALTMDYRVERINVKIERGIVTDAYSG
jgi:hypothetical protein